ncbi:MAG TPA: hypothetical protein QGG47_13575 [Acidobacteriota bacterium]|nr:hypothetical protein [Acidobacteriota bacterium]
MNKRVLAWCCVTVAIAVSLGWIYLDGEAALVDPPMRSIGALEFADGVLFASDSVGGTLYALEVGSVGMAPEEFEAVGSLDAKIAEMLGTTSSEIFVKDLAADSKSGVAYLSIMRGSGSHAEPVLVKVTPDGEVHHVDLAQVAYTKHDLTNAPADQPGERRNPRSMTITDIELLGDELFVAGLSNEEFASVMRRVPWPFASAADATGLEIYHGAHAAYETHAPIYTFLPVELDGEEHVLAGYLCTPLATFSLEEMRGADRMRGKTIAELGFGNVPIDMVAFEQNGEEYALMTNSRRGTMKIPMSDIRAAHRNPSIEEEVGPRTGVDYEGAPLGLVVQIDKLRDDALLILERLPENGAPEAFGTRLRVDLS